ncbi:WSC domain-containing protein [Aureococcus anophagefferens]|nr:WSC domain-containing protein [Aureococcus anophagefferens]
MSRLAAVSFAACAAAYTAPRSPAPRLGPQCAERPVGGLEAASDADYETWISGQLRLNRVQDKVVGIEERVDRKPDGDALSVLAEPAPWRFTSPLRLASPPAFSGGRSARASASQRAAETAGALVGDVDWTRDDGMDVDDAVMQVAESSDVKSRFRPGRLDGKIRAETSHPSRATTRAARGGNDAL